MLTFRFDSESDLYLTINALRLAAAEYGKYADSLKGAPESLKRQFSDQTAAALRIADALENTDTE